MHEAKTQLSKLVERAEGGRGDRDHARGEPAVRLDSRAPGRWLRFPGRRLAGSGEIAEDFDELPDDLAESLGMRP